MKDISICVAHRGDAIGLWMTLHSCMMALENSKLDYEFCVCINGEADRRKQMGLNQSLVCPDTDRVLHFLHRSGKLGYAKLLQHSVSPPTGRQIASDRASGKYIFFLDAHCMVKPDYFETAIRDFENSDMDLIHSNTRFFEGEQDSYHYILTLEDNFWGYSAYAPSAPGLHPVAAGGHGGFAVRSSVWKDLGGYWPGFIGYGGEELSIDLQLWMRGYKVGLDPHMLHYHWSGLRGYARHFTGDYYRNMMMSANIIGGEKYLNKVYQNFSGNYPELTRHPFFDLFLEAYYRSEEYSRELGKLSIRNLDEQLQWFKENGIPH